MPCFNTHLAIAKLYAKRNKIKDLDAFFKGTIDPDLTDCKDETHYGKTPNTFENVWVRVENKVNLAAFLAHNRIDNDLNLGRFLHLITDMKFFHEFFGKEILSSAEHDPFSADLYHSYAVIGPYLIDRYNLKEIGIDKIIDTGFMQKKIQQTNDKVEEVRQSTKYSPKCILDTKRLDKFIRETAKIDLRSYMS